MSIERRYVQTDLGVPMEFVTYSDHLAEIGRVREDEREATLTEVHKWVMRLPYEIDGEIWIDRDDVEAIIERLRTSGI